MLAEKEDIKPEDTFVRLAKAGPQASEEVSLVV